MLFAGYPITPATEIAELMARRLPQAGGIYVQGEDELASLGIVLGASAAGWKAMTATSGNGICLMQEEIGYAAMTEIPCVIDAKGRGPNRVRHQHAGGVSGPPRATRLLLSLASFPRRCSTHH
jgi:pyruvate/2-oxoacid:ferredoxin oxidoreductase alpha subunit